jgi:multiple sugar transport system ATP-binding protein
MVYVTHDQVEAMTMADKIVVLQAGLIEQMGSPLELYHYPRNIFVAGFIGSPKMNFVPTGVVAVRDGAAAVALPGGGQVEVPVAPGRLAEGTAVTLGIRPEHMRPGEEGQVRGEVLVVERLGGTTYLHVRVPGGHLLTVQADGDAPIRMHDEVGLSFHPGDAHLFFGDGLAVPKASRPPLADERVPGAQGPASGGPAALPGDGSAPALH